MGALGPARRVLASACRVLGLRFRELGSVFREEAFCAGLVTSAQQASAAPRCQTFSNLGVAFHGINSSS